MTTKDDLSYTDAQAILFNYVHSQKSKVPEVTFIALANMLNHLDDTLKLLTASTEITLLRYNQMTKVEFRKLFPVGSQHAVQYLGPHADLVRGNAGLKIMPTSARLGWLTREVVEQTPHQMSSKFTGETKQGSISSLSWRGVVVYRHTGDPNLFAVCDNARSVADHKPFLELRLFNDKSKVEELVGPGPNQTYTG